MAGSSLLRKSVLAALAATVSIAALPVAAQAQERHGRGGWQGGGERGGGERGGWQGGGGRNWQGGAATQQSAQQPTQQPVQPTRPVMQQQPRSLPAWRGGQWRDGGNAERAQQAPQPAQQGAQPMQRWRGNGEVARQNDGRPGDRGESRDIVLGREGRNQTYADPNRNGTYRDGNRDRSENRADGRWQGNRQDGYRNDGWRNDGWRGANRGGSNWSGRSDDNRRWNNDWRRDRRYDWSSYRNQHRDIFRGGSYYAPYRGYNYSRIRTGFFLDALFYSNNYWIADPWAYRLPDVYGPYRWVRYYDDVLLVDVYSGEVVDVIYDFFW